MIDDDWLQRHRDHAREALMEIKGVDMAEIAALYQSLYTAVQERTPALELFIGRKWYTVIPDSKYQQYYFFDACMIRNILSREDVDE